MLGDCNSTLVKNTVPVLEHLAIHIRQCTASEVVKVWTIEMKVVIICTVIEFKTIFFLLPPYSLSMFHITTNSHKVCLPAGESAHYEGVSNECPSVFTNL